MMVHESIDRTYVLCYIEDMHRKEVYEHLAQIYLGASNNKRKTPIQRAPLFKYLFALSLIVIASLVFVLGNVSRNQRPAVNKEIALVIEPGLTQMNFDFNLAKKEILRFDLAGLNLAEYESLKFLARKVDVSGNLHLHLGLRNRLGESSEFYLKDISGQWHDFKIALADFKGITEWSDMAELEFVIEAWNTNAKNGKLYIDTVRFLK
ncbi:MAG: hypothetical protein ABIC18_03475 [Candidatus Omnitrophota bacterium]